METKEARVFLAVAEELHFARAAARLHLAQPPVTRIIRQLERSLDAQLFERTTRHVALTQQGLALVGPARLLLEADAHARQVVRAAALGDFGEVKVAFASASTQAVIGRLARRVRRERPGISFLLFSQNLAQGLMRRLMDGEVDIGFGRWDYIPPEIESRVIADEQLVIAVSSGHPAASLRGVFIREFASETFVSLPAYSGSVLIDRLERLGRAAGFIPEIGQIAPDTATAMAMVAAEIGPSLTLSTVAENILDPHIAFVPVLDESIPVQLRMAWRADRSATPSLRAVLELSEAELPSPAGSH